MRKKRERFLIFERFGTMTVSDHHGGEDDEDMSNSIDYSGDDERAATMNEQAREARR